MVNRVLEAIGSTERHCSIAEIQHALVGGLKVQDLTAAYLGAIHASDLNAFITICDERAMQQARDADRLIAALGAQAFVSRPLLGIPIGVKDNIAIAGVLMTCASKMLENYVPPYTATAIKRLEDAGAIVLGKLNMDEFAMGGSGENSAYGLTRHPVDKTLVPGGSSSGSAAAVRGGLCVAALGTDTGGSIRLPASFCGIHAIKPTYGTVSRFGLVAFASTLDQIGPMTRSLVDAELMLGVMSGRDQSDMTSIDYTYEPIPEPDFSKLRIGVPEEYFGLMPDIEAKVLDAMAWFESKGAQVQRVSLPHCHAAIAVYYLVAVAEASSNLARFDGVRFGSRLDGVFEGARALFGPEVKRRIILGTFALSARGTTSYYKQANYVRAQIREDFERVFQQVDLIIGPVTPTGAYKIGAQMSDPLQMYLNDFYTIPANLAGIPALSVPAGKVGELDVGLQVMAPWRQDALAVAAARVFDKEFLHGRI